MKSSWKLASRCLLACVAAALCVGGWVAESSQAQDAPRSAPSLLGSDKLSSQDLRVPRVEGATRPAQQGLNATRSEPIAADGPAGSEVDSEETVVPGDATLAAESGEDPEKSALAFAEGAQKLAEAQRRALKDEETRLKARLQKVEAGIKRWDNVLAGLKQSQGASGRFSALKPAPGLEPAPISGADR